MIFAIKTHNRTGALWLLFFLCSTVESQNETYGIRRTKADKGGHLGGHLGGQKYSTWADKIRSEKC